MSIRNLYSTAGQKEHSCSLVYHTIFLVNLNGFAFELEGYVYKSRESCTGARVHEDGVVGAYTVRLVRFRGQKVIKNDMH